MLKNKKSSAKKAILNEIRLKLKNTGIAHTPTSTYLTGICSLLATNKKIDLNNFLKLYSQMLSIKQIPLLNIPTVLFVAENYHKNPALINQLKHMVELTKGNRLNWGIWEGMIKALSCREIENFGAKSLLITKILEPQFNIPENYCMYFFFNTIFAMDSNMFFDHKRIDCDGQYAVFNEKFQARYGLFIFWTHQILREGKNIRFHFEQMVNKQFKDTKEWATWSPKMEAFLLFINDKLPANYMIHHQAQKYLYRYSEIYAIKKDLFKTTPVTSEELMQSSFILEPFFKYYAIPRLFFKKYYQLEYYQYCLLLHILKGNPIHHYKGLPLTMTKKANHILRTVDFNDNYDFWQHFVAAKLHANGASKEFNQSVCNMLNRRRSHYDFWIYNLMILFHKGLKPFDVATVSDYINAKVFVENATIDFKNISVATLFKRSEEWHKDMQIQRMRRIKLPTLLHIEPYDFVDKQLGKRFIIKQITNSHELYEEGALLYHCVYTYLYSCMRRWSYIFSMRQVNDQEEEPLVTIEIDNRNTIVQARGKHNRAATNSERMIMELWSLENNLHISDAA